MGDSKEYLVFPIPYVQNFEGSYKIFDGFLLKASKYCHNNIDKPICQNFYKNLEKDNRNSEWVLCPKGFLCRPFFGEKSYASVAGVFLESKKPQNNKYVKNHGERVKDFLIEDNLANKYYEHILPEIVWRADAENKIQSFSCTIHDVQKLNSQNKELIEASYINAPETDLPNRNIDELVYSIAASTNLIQARFSMFDYFVNPSSVSRLAKFPVGMYKKMDKMCKIFSFNTRKVKFTINGSSYSEISGSQQIEYLCCLILDNMIKYAPLSGYTVSVNFVEDADTINLRVSSYGPKCSKEELTKIFNYGFRGKNASKTADGNGIGLYICKKICDLHSIRISAEFDYNNITIINGVEYGLFSIILDCPILNPKSKPSSLFGTSQ